MFDAEESVERQGSFGIVYLRFRKKGLSPVSSLRAVSSITELENEEISLPDFLKKGRLG